MMSDPHETPPKPALPMNHEAEQRLLGAVLLDNAKLAKAAPFLVPGRFCDPIHGVIYAAICRVVEAGLKANAVMICTEFEGTDILDKVKGNTYLHQLETQPDLEAVNAHDYAESIHDAWVRRELIRVAEHLHALAVDAIQGAYGEAVSDFGEASGIDQAGYLAARLRGLLALVETAAGTPA